MRWRVEEHDGKDIQVPHAVDAGEEGAVHLHRVLPPVPVALIHLHPDPRQTRPSDVHSTCTVEVIPQCGDPHLTDDEEDDGHGCAEQGDQHQELEPEN